MKNHQLIQVQTFEDTIVIQTNIKNEQGRAALNIDRTTLKFSETYKAIHSAPIKNKSYFAFLGMMRCEENGYMCFCDDAVFAAEVGDQKFYRIENVSFVPVNEARQNRDSLALIEDVRKFIKEGGMYFSTGGDPTMSLQQSLHERKQRSSFVWNILMLKPLKECNISYFWQQPMIQGFIQQFESRVLQKKVIFTIISRRSTHLGGTRYNARGIDDDGNVANFVETEQIIQQGKYLFSFVSLRGSVPIFWSQEGINNSIKITRSQILTQSAFNKHFQELSRCYGNIMIVDLLSPLKPHEQPLIEHYEEGYRNLNREAQVKYMMIDFSEICKRGFERINPKILELGPVAESFSFFWYDQQTLQVIRRQTGVFRINCLDCLDRTNAFMSKLFLLLLRHELKHIDMDFDISRLAQSGDDWLGMLDEHSKKTQYDFITFYKNAWADNGDALSIIYAGTGAINSDITRDGKKSLMGILENGMKSLGRRYQQAFEDSLKQKQINMLLSGISDQAGNQDLDNHMRKSEHSYSEYSKINVHILTWNVNGRLPQNNLKSTIFNYFGNPAPELIVIGLQEMVPLNPQNVMIMSNENYIIQWLSIIDRHLQDGTSCQYVRIEHCDLVGIFLTVYVKKTHVNRVSGIEVDVVKTGLGGALGNKGATAVRMKIDDSQFVFINTHLSSGQKQFETRNQEVRDIHERLFQKRLRFSEIDYQFFIGDMNYRIDGQYTLVTGAIESYESERRLKNFQKSEKIFNYMLAADQLKKSQADHEILNKYQEGNITFLPTYKFDTGTDTYDTSKKQRTPSWCDRILYWRIRGRGIELHFYHSHKDQKESDHKPVTANFTVQVRKIDPQRMKATQNEFYHSQSTEQNKETFGEEIKQMRMESSIFSEGFLNIQQNQPSQYVQSQLNIPNAKQVQEIDLL